MSTLASMDRTAIGRTNRPGGATGNAQDVAVDAAVFVIWTFVVSVYVYKSWYIAAALALTVVLLLGATGRLRTDGLLPALVPVLVYFAVLLAGALWAEFPDETILWVAIDSISIAVFTLFFIAGRNAPPGAIVTALSTICIPSVAIAALNYALEPWATRSAQYAVEVLPFITPFLCLRAATVRPRWPSLVALAATFAVLVVGRSRTPLGTAGLLTVLSVFAFRRSTRSALRDAFVYGTVIAALLGALLFFPVPRKLVVGMFVRLTHIGVDWGDLHIPPEPVNQERVDLTRISMDMLPHSLPFGIGYMNFTLYFEDVTGYRLPLHNMYMTWLLEGGVACVLVVLVLATMHVRSLRRYIRRGTAEQRGFGQACLLASLGLLPLGAFHQVHQMPALWMLLGLGAACGAEARRPGATAETD
jgi:hypothetical protein